MQDINELELPKTCKTVFPDPDELLSFKLIIYPDEGFYRNGEFNFSFKIGAAYPHEPPKVRKLQINPCFVFIIIIVNIQVKCETKVYHPNIDLDGNVCLNILREDWKPVLTINSIVYGLQYLFLVSTLSGRVDKNQDDTRFFFFQEPNPEDPLNKEAALELQNNRRLFEQNVGKSMRGGSINGVYFERCYK